MKYLYSAALLVGLAAIFCFSPIIFSAARSTTAGALLFLAGVIFFFRTMATLES